MTLALSEPRVFRSKKRPSLRQNCRCRFDIINSMPSPRAFQLPGRILASELQQAGTTTQKVGESALSELEAQQPFPISQSTKNSRFYAKYPGSYWRSTRFVFTRAVLSRTCLFAPGRYNTASLRDSGRLRPRKTDLTMPRHS